MLSTCKTGCNPAVTITKTDHCKVYERSENGVRLLYAKCDFDFPSGAYDDNTLAVAIATAITNGDIGASFELSEFEWGDATRTEKKFRNKKKRSKSVITGRDLTARTYVATDFDEAGTADAFWDRKFYKGVENNIATEVRGYVTAEGEINLFLNEEGEFIDAVLETEVKFDGDLDTDTIEYKEYRVKLSDDPLQYRVLPYLDIKAASAVATLGWLFEGNPVE